MSVPTVPITATPNRISRIFEILVDVIIVRDAAHKLGYCSDVATIGPKSISTPAPATMEMPQAFAAGSC